MAGPDEIDVNLTLADETALNNFIDAVNNLTAALGTMGTQGTSGGGGSGGPGNATGKTGGDQPMVAESMTASGKRSIDPQSVNLPLDTKMPEIMKRGLDKMPQPIQAFAASGISPYRQFGEIVGDLQAGNYMEAYGGVQLATQAYGGLAHRFVPAPFDPLSATSIGQGWGVGGAGETVAIPGTGIGMMLPTGGAAHEYYGNVFDAFQAGLAPGQSARGAWEAMTAQEELGWHGSKQDQMYEAYKNIIGNQESRYGDKGLTMQMMDQAVRLGQTSLEDFTNTMKTLPDVAQAANMNVDEFKQQLDQVANTLQSQGLTYGQGMQAGMRFSGVTNLSPLVGQDLMQNQYIQANMMGRYGMFPEQQGLLFSNTGAFMDTTMDTISQMRSLYKGGFQDKNIQLGKYGTTTISGKDQTDAMVAGAMGMSIDELQNLERNAKRSKKQGLIGDMATEYNREVSALHRKLESGELNDEQYRRKFENLREGSGGYAGNAISWNEVVDAMSGKHSGFGKRFVDQISNDMAPGDRSRAILNHIKHQDANSGSVGKNTIDLTPAAKRLVRIVEDQGINLTMDQERAIAQSGQGRINDSMSDNNAVYPSRYGPLPGSTTGG